MTKASISNALWLLNQRHHYQSFCKKMNEAQSIQFQILMRYIRHNEQTEFGQNHQFSDIHSYADFARHVPIIENYDVLRPYTEGVALGKPNVLTKEKVLFFEETSGSTSQSKLIPYTAQLKHEFQTAVGVWMQDLYRTNPSCFQGKAYWSLSPALKKGYYTEGGISVGIPDDTAYFNPLAAYLLKNIMAVDSAELSNIKDSDAFYIATLQSLLTQHNSLSFMSVWSPVFFLQLDSFLLNNIDFILNSLKPNAKLNKLLNFIKNKNFQWHDVFPHLKLISCWTDAQAALWIPEVQNRLGNIKIQGKGLLATEGVTTIPFGNGDAILAYTSHFFEFQCLKTNDIVLINNLQLHHEYEVILTTGGGLYRYATHDIVLVTAKLNDLPRLKFQGRKSVAVDMVGEKLHETHVTQAVTEGVQKCAIQHKGVFVYGVKCGNQSQYKLLITNDLKDNYLPFLENLEIDFCKNPYYLQARKLGQLLPLEAFFVSSDFSEILTNFYKKQKQIRDGDVKLPVIYPPLFLKEIIGF